jgi:hypothetical protein
MTTTLLRQTRDEVLRNTDLIDLFNTAHPEATSTNSWPCPRHHDNTRSLNVFGEHAQTRRWHCSICGAGGNAIDFVMYTHDLAIGDAITHLQHLPMETGKPKSPIPLPPPVAQYLELCQQLLWSSSATSARAWLSNKGLLHEPTLLANGIGFDPGTHQLKRPKGIPANGPSLTFPIRCADIADPVSIQTLPLHASGENNEWISPSHNLDGPPPTAWITTYQESRKSFILTDNLLDALSAATIGHQAITILASTAPDKLTALCQQLGVDSALMSFRNDASAEIVAAELHTIDLARLQLPDDVYNLNELLQRQSNS